MNTDACPHCGVSLLGAEIPREQRNMFGGAAHFRRDILIEVRGAYDGGLFYQCPDCGGQWHRFPAGHYLRDVAARHMTKPAQEAA